MSFHSQISDSGKLVFKHSAIHLTYFFLTFSVSGLENKRRSGPIFKRQLLAIGLFFQGCFSASSYLSTVPLSHLFSDRTGHSSHKKLIPNSLEAIKMIVDLILLFSKVIKKNMSTLLKILQLSDFHMAMVIWYAF